MATKTELLTALQTIYPKSEGETNANYITRLEASVQKNLDRQRARWQEKLDAVPTTAREFLKEEALKVLAQQAEDSYLKANTDSTLE